MKFELQLSRHSNYAPFEMKFYYKLGFRFNILGDYDHYKKPTIEIDSIEQLKNFIDTHDGIQIENNDGNYILTIIND